MGDHAQLLSTWLMDRAKNASWMNSLVVTKNRGKKNSSVNTISSTALTFGERAFDLFVHQADAPDSADLGMGDMPEPEDTAADTTVDVTDWPDEFLEIG